MIERRTYLVIDIVIEIGLVRPAEFYSYNCLNTAYLNKMKWLLFASTLTSLSVAKGCQ